MAILFSPTRPSVHIKTDAYPTHDRAKVRWVEMRLISSSLEPPDGTARRLQIAPKVALVTLGLSAALASVPAPWAHLIEHAHVTQGNAQMHTRKWLSSQHVCT